MEASQQAWFATAKILGETRRGSRGAVEPSSYNAPEFGAIVRGAGTISPGQCPLGRHKRKQAQTSSGTAYTHPHYVCGPSTGQRGLHGLAPNRPLAQSGPCLLYWSTHGVPNRGADP